MNVFSLTNNAVNELCSSLTVRHGKTLDMITAPNCTAIFQKRQIRLESHIVRWKGTQELFVANLVQCELNQQTPGADDNPVFVDG